MSVRNPPMPRLGGYEVLAQISEGGMALVYLGRAPSSKRLVALKVVRPELCRTKEFVTMLLDEAKIVARLSHPHIVEVLELGMEGRRPFLAMEFLHGQTLLTVWDACKARQAKLPYEMVAWMGARVARALHYAHEAKDEQGRPQHVVHRDVNPSNLFVTYDGTLKVIDFGLAKAVGRSSNTAAGVVKGKLAYLAPEQTHGHSADRRADVFALGVTLWELTVDRRLFRADDDIETVRRVQKANVPDPTSLVADYPPALERIVMRALARDPKDRYPNADVVARELETFLQGYGKDVGPHKVATLMRELFPEERPMAHWEYAVRSALGDGAGPMRPRASSVLEIEAVEEWDVEGERAALLRAAAELPGVPPPLPAQDAARPSGKALREELVELLAVRTASLSRGQDPVGLARAHLELGLVDEALGDGSRVVAHAEMALKAQPQLTAAHALMRRARHARGAAAALLTHLDHEIAACVSEQARADLLAERARLVEASGERPTAIRAAWERALAAAPTHPAALKGLEAVLAASSEGGGGRGDVKPETRAIQDAFAQHLARMADAYAGEPRIAAWLHVERARILDRQLGQREAAWGALEKALELDPGVGPVRSACVRHACAHRDAATLVSQLAREAELETDGARGARLELDAACLARMKLGDPERAVVLLERAAARGPTSRLVARRVLDELVELHEAAGRAGQAMAARRARLSYIEDPRAQAHEHRALAALAEQLGDTAAALADTERAYTLEPDDTATREAYDRLLTEAGKHTSRVALWTKEAARHEDGAKRAEALRRAAQIAEEAGRKREATEHLRAALVANPADPELHDELARLLTPPPAEGVIEALRDRIAVFAHAAEKVGDPARRVAYLEKIALLWEEIAGDAPLAARTYEEILALEPHRRGAIVGLARAAARAKDPRGIARALVEEAESTRDELAKPGLLARAAEATAHVDPERALALVAQVLARDPSHAQARALEARIHEQAGRWEMVDRALAARIERTADKAEKVSLWLARASLQRTRLNSPADALASLKAARQLDPKHPVPPEAITHIVEATSDARGLRAALEELARGAATPEDRARALTRAAEIDEILLEDDGAAAALYARAAADLPGEPLLRERLTRVVARRTRTAPPKERASLIAMLPEPSPDEVSRAFELALVRVEAGTDLPRALDLVDAVLAADPDDVRVLRTLEALARTMGSTPAVANALSLQADAFGPSAARLGALWAMASLVEWRLPEGGGIDPFDRILALAPSDRAALDAVLRRTLPAARAGDAGARASAIKALRGLLAHAPDDTSRLALRLQLGMLLEKGAEGETNGDDEKREALEQYRAALQADPLSVAAARGTARLAFELGDAEADVASSVAQADLSADARARAQALLHAGRVVLGDADPRFGAPEERRKRGAELLERALDASPECVPAAGILAAVLTEAGERDRLVATLRSALQRARLPEAIAAMGTELARIARLDPPDLGVAVDAMERVRGAAPTHVRSLLTLAELYLARRAWHEAAEVLEQAAGETTDTGPRLAALMALANVYDHALGRPRDVERVLRTAAAIDPRRPRVLRGLIRRLKAAEGGAPAAATAANGTNGEPREGNEAIRATRRELAALLERLAEAEGAPAEKATVFLELAELRASLGDRAGAEQALVEAAAQTPEPPVLARLSAFHGNEPTGYARLLAAAVARAQELGRVDASLLMILGQLEVGPLGRLREGVVHLRAALAASPSSHEARLGLSEGLLRLGAGEEAISVLMAMLVPDATPLVSLPNPPAALELLERAFAGERRGEEAMVVRELRALSGGVDPAELRARRLAYDDLATQPIDRATIWTSVLPPDGRHVLLDVAAAIAGVDARVLRGSLAEIGVSPRNRLDPRQRHPLRNHFDRLLRVLMLQDVELAVTDHVTHTRVVVQDVPWVVAPSALAAEPDPVQIASLARPLLRIALGVPWIEDLPPLYVHAYLTGAARVAVPEFAAEPRDASFVDAAADYERRIRSALSRRQKKQLTDFAPHLETARGASLREVEALVSAIVCAELRLAFLFTGDLLATFDALRLVDPSFARLLEGRDVRALAAVIAHPLAGDLCRFALSREATALRWRTGAVWGRISREL